MSAVLLKVYTVLLLGVWILGGGEVGSALAVPPPETNCLPADPLGAITLPDHHCGLHADDQGALLSTAAYKIPTVDDWQATHHAFSRGTEGEWDHYLYGGFANSLIKKGDTYYLYYQGSPTYDTNCESVSHRAIGVATSTDGIHWVKSDKNPVIAWSSQGSIEEGAVSSAVWLGTDNKIYLYYGANTGSGCTIRASARLAVSENGEDFQELGEVLSGSDPNIWGGGDEIFPIGVYAHDDQWYLYYTPNGVPLSRKLGVATGSAPTTFTQTSGLNNSTIPAWGPVSVISEDSTSVLVTNPNDGSGAINIYTFDTANPSLVALYDSYVLPNCNQVSVIYESSVPQWVLSCRDQTAGNYYIKRADALHTFADVPQMHWAWSLIERLYSAAITGGCANNPMRYCPESTVTRDQMAVFLLRGIHGSSYTPPAVGGSTGFGDVPPNYWAAAWIKQLAADGITGGCGNGNYCPGTPVTRDQMAVFLLKAQYGKTYNPPAVGGSTGFKDVPPDHWAAAWIKQLAAEGITGGCGVGTYCPGNPVNRAEMAVFLVRTFNLP
jgi:hypothetical protein